MGEVLFRDKQLAKLILHMLPQHPHFLVSDWCLSLPVLCAPKVNTLLMVLNQFLVMAAFTILLSQSSDWL
jgi:hypothetical protein